MAVTTRPSTTLLFDDEPHNLQYIVDYLSFKGLECIIALNADDASELLQKEIYRAVIIDLNIPISVRLAKSAGQLGEIYLKYPGLYIAHVARNKGYRDRQVVVYSVHKEEAIVAEARKLGFSYLIKGRPLEIKSELDDVLAFDPTTPLVNSK